MFLHYHTGKEVFFMRKHMVRNTGMMILALLAGIYDSFRIVRYLPFPWNRFLGIVISIFSLFCLMFQAYSTSDTVRIRRGYQTAILISGIYIGFLTYHMMLLIVTDFFYLPLRFAAHLPLKRYPFDIADLLLTLGIVTYGAIHARRPKVVPYRIRLAEGDSGSCPDLPAVPGHSYHIVLLSDLHVGSCIGEHFIHNIVQQVNRLHPDLILIAGDILNHADPHECTTIHGTERELSHLQAKDGVLAVTGNHDASGSDPDFRRFLERSHIRLIDDLTVETPAVNVVGRTGSVPGVGSVLRVQKTNDCPAPLTKDNRTSLKALMRRCNPCKPVVVLDHDPDGVPEACLNQADLILCGHTHHGQFFPCNYFTRWHYGKSLLGGYSRQGKTQIVVSSGCGCFQTSLRIGTDSEISDLHLTLH